MIDYLKTMVGIKKDPYDLLKEEFDKLSLEDKIKLQQQRQIEITQKFDLSQGQHTLIWGKCGLVNLGNTCFMASALQCMSNIEKLTFYIISKEWLSDVNPFLTKSKGTLICEYYKMLKKMWCYKNKYIKPSGVKNTIKKVSSTFAGFSQQDSQEFLSYFIDVLNDDINRVFKKEYIQQEDYNKQEIFEFAKKSWNDFKKRNQSYIINLFYGQFYTEITCPTCDHQSITCDPYDMISLNITENNPSVSFEGYIIFQSYEYPVYKYEFMVSAQWNVYEVIELILKEIEIQQDKEFSYEDFGAYTIKDSQILNKFTLNKDSKVCDLINSKSYLFLLEEFNQNVFESFLDGKEEILNKKEFVLDLRVIDEDSKDCAIEKIIVVPQSMSVKDIYVLILVLHQTALLQANCENFKEFEKFKNYDKESKQNLVNIFFPDKKANQDSLFYIMINNKEQKNLECDENIFENGKTLKVKVFFKKQKCENKINFKTCKNLKIQNISKKNSNISLHDCFEHFITKEQLDIDNTWYCSKCKNHQEAYIKRALIKSPEILIIHLKRFQKKIKHNSIYYTKKTFHVDFPIDKLDLTEYMIKVDDKQDYTYWLIGIINHFGYCGGGHYTAYCKNFLDQKWYEFNDEDVSEISEDNLVMRSAYVLFYQRV